MQFLDKILLDIAGEPQSYAEFTTTSSTSSTPDEIATVVRAAFVDALFRNTPETTFRTKLSKVGVDATAIETLASSLFKAKVNGVFASSARRAIAENVGKGGGRLVDFDWSVNHVLSSDKLAIVGEPLVQLTLQVQTRLGSSSMASSSSSAINDNVETLRMELNAEDLDGMIAQLQAASAVAAAGTSAAAVIAHTSSSSSSNNNSIAASAAAAGGGGSGGVVTPGKGAGAGGR